MGAMELRPDSRGKVRDIYDCGDSLLMVASDRISASLVVKRLEVADVVVLKTAPLGGVRRALVKIKYSAIYHLE